MNWLSFFIGLLVGWLIQWALDYFFWRRRRLQTEEGVAVLQTRLKSAEDEARDLGSQLSQCRRDADACAAEVASKDAALQEKAAELAAAQKEQAMLREQLAEAQAKITSLQARPPEPEDFRKIEGIGPKIARLLHREGLLTFEQLAQAEVEHLRAILEKAGSRFRMANPESWPEQARLAAAGDWAELEALQKDLVGGRRRD